MAKGNQLYQWEKVAGVIAKATLILVIWAVFFPIAFASGESSYINASAVGAVKEQWELYRGKVAREAGICAIEMRTLPEGKTILADNSHQPLITASLMKVLTSLAALKKLGPTHTFTTEIRGPSIQGGTIPGSLTIFSNGNPLWFARDVKACVDDFVRSTGLRLIKGSVNVDQSFFSPSVEQLCVDGKCYKSYNPLISPVAIDFNNITLTVYPGDKIGSPPKVLWDTLPSPVPVIISAKTVSGKQRSNISFRLVSSKGKDGYQGVVSGTISVKDVRGVSFAVRVYNPSRFVEGAVKSALANAGVSLGSATNGGYEDAVKLYSCKTPTIAEVLHGLNKHSNNFMAEMVFRNLGGEIFGRPGTREKGARVVEQVLKELGVPPGEFYIDSGSGLSYSTKASVNVFQSALVYLYNNPHIGQAFMDSLAENGHTGTLKKHWAGEPFTIKGKTGTLANVVGFSGYVFWNQGTHPLALTFICNNVTQTWKARHTVEEFVKKAVAILRGGK